MSLPFHERACLAASSPPVPHPHGHYAPDLPRFVLVFRDNYAGCYLFLIYLRQFLHRIAIICAIKSLTFASHERQMD